MGDLTPYASYAKGGGGSERDNNGSSMNMRCVVSVVRGFIDVTRTKIMRNP